MSTRRWPSSVQAFHWASAALVLVQLPLGWAAQNAPLSPRKLDLFVWHKSLGVVILLVTLARIGARLSSRTPPAADGAGRCEAVLARGVHGALYAMLLALPLSGWILQSASNVPFRVFRWIPLPSLVSPDKRLADVAATCHGLLVAVLCALLLAHIGAALVHHFARRDDVLLGMLGRGAARR